MPAKKMGVFVIGTMKSFFFVTNGTDRHEILAKCQLISSIEPLIEEFRKFLVKG